MKPGVRVLRIASAVGAAILSVMFSAHSIVRAAQPQESGSSQGQVADEIQRIPLFGKISAVHNNSLEITDVNGATVKVNLTDKTEYRKDRQPVKRSDFKVGDVIVVRGEENPDHSWTAQLIGARSMNANGPDGRRGGPGGRNEVFGGPPGTLGKDFVTGEIKSIDAPKLSVLRADKVTQTLELNEDTSLRKGRESITMADIQVGDHLFARGALQNDVFVPKVVVVIGPEQWKRMQEMAGSPDGQHRPPSVSPGGDVPAQKPESQP